MAEASIAVLARARSRVGEGPVFFAGGLLWVDILAGDIHVTNLDDGDTETISVPTWVGAAAPMMGGGFVAATREGFATVINGNFKRVLNILPAGVRMNDAKCDPDGRFWAGSCAEDFAAGRGALHRLGADWSHSVIVEGLTQPNGIGWSPEADVLYLVDTQERVLYAFAFDLESGSVGERTVIARFAERDGYPDGLAVDSAGDIWIAMWGGSQVIHLTPSGEVIERLPLPVAQTSSCAFVGPDLKTLCVTSAAEGLAVSSDSLDGSVFLVSGLTVPGVPVADFAGGQP